MGHPQRTSGRQGATLIALAFVPCVILLYVLSTGPAIYLYRVSGYPPGFHHALDVLCAPLDWAHNHTPARGPIEWYVELWQ